MPYTRVARYRSMASQMLAASAGTNITGARACHCWSAIVQPAMWKRGNGQTIGPLGSKMPPGWVRRKLRRWVSTTPLGRPVLPLVKKMTWGSSSSRADSPMSASLSLAAAARRRVSGISGVPTLAATVPASTRSSSTTNKPGRAADAVSTASSKDSAGFIGANTAPSLASAANSGMTSMSVADHTATRSP